MASAIVTGATGITGSAIVRHLLKEPQYNEVFTLSRSQTGENHGKIKHATVDLQSPADEMAKDLSHVQGEVIFFCAYIARDSEDEAAKINETILQNFIDALHLTGALKRVRRIVLTCGLKQYGVHLGQTKQPMHESDQMPLPERGNWPPNFYYNQQKVLIENAKKGNYTWTVTFPQDVIGVAKGNFMNEATALGLYASVAKLAHPNAELPFPGSKASYLGFNCWTSAELHARFALWAAQAPNAANQVFNVVNGDTESWQNLWPKVAARFGCTIPKEMFKGGDRSTYDGFEAAGPTNLHDPPPVAIQATSDQPGEGFGMPELTKPSTLYQQIDTAKWARDLKVVKAWDSLRENYNLDQETWDKATWSFLTFVLGREYSCVVSMSKARRMGWNGYQDTWEAFDETFTKLEEAGILPPVSKLKQEKPLT